jgi:hypothetical protein
MCFAVFCQRQGYLAECVQGDWRVGPRGIDRLQYKLIICRRTALHMSAHGMLAASERSCCVFSASMLCNLMDAAVVVCSFTSNISMLGMVAIRLLC